MSGSAGNAFLNTGITIADPLDGLSKLTTMGLQDQQKQNLQTQNTKAQNDLNQQIASDMAKSTGSLLSNPDPNSRVGPSGYNNVKDQLFQILQQNKNIPNARTEYETALGSVPPPTGADGQPTDYTQYIRQHYLAARNLLSGSEAAGMMTSPSPSLVDTGTSMVPVQQGSGVSRLGGAPQPLTVGGNPVSGSGIGLGLSPSAGAGMVAVPNADGTSTPMSTRDWNNWNNQGSPRDQSGRPAVQTMPVPNEGVQPSPPMNRGIPQNYPTGLPGGPAVSQPGTGLQGGGPAPVLAPGDKGTPQAPIILPNANGPKPVISSPTSNSLAVAQTQAQKQQDDVTRLSSPQWQTGTQALNSVINLSPTSLSGKGTDWLGNAKAVITNLAPAAAATLGINQGNVDDRAELAKAMARISLANGNRSDAELFQQYESNPNMSMPPGAVQNVARTIVGLNNQERALTLEAASRAQNLPQNPQTHYGAVKTSLAQQTDLNGFTPMSDSQFQQYVKSLPPKNTPQGQEARIKLKNAQDLQDKYNNPNTGSMPMGQPSGQTP